MNITRHDLFAFLNLILLGALAVALLRPAPTPSVHVTNSVPGAAVSLSERIYDFAASRNSEVRRDMQYITQGVASTSRRLSSLEGQKAEGAFLVTAIDLNVNPTSLPVKLKMSVGKRIIGEHQADNLSGAGLAFHYPYLEKMELPAPIVINAGEQLDIELECAAGFSAASEATLFGLRINPDVADEWLAQEGELRLWETYLDDNTLNEKIRFTGRGELTHLWRSDGANLTSFTSMHVSLDGQGRCAGDFMSKALPNPSPFPNEVVDDERAPMRVFVENGAALHFSATGGSSSSVRFFVLGTELVD